MQIGSWPGALSGNAFLNILAAAFDQLGARLVPVKRPSHGVIPDLDALLIQWPDVIFWKARLGRAPYLAAFSELRALRKWRRSGKKLIWIVHNAVPHDLNARQLRLWSYYSRQLSALSHGYMTLSPSTQSTVLRDHPELSTKPASSFRHPSYTFVKRTPQEILDRRLKLGIPADAHVIGALGRIGHYKGLPELIEAFRAIEDDRLRLVICGKPKNASTRTDVETATANEPRIRLCFDFLTDEDFALTTAACDAIVAPYREYLHSGSLVYSVSAERRLLTPRTPFAEDLSNCVGPGWITLYDGRLTSSLLGDFAAATPQLSKPDLSALDPILAAREILKFVQGISV
jgi:glycosyltransferase involved in cell wall biosynthesis